MASSNGRYVISFNGEVYNFEQLRMQLDAESRITWRGHSDTEVILAAIEAWGLAGAIDQFTGMFAFALWDKREQVLHLVRDRLGIKPLYYHLDGPVFLFGSELKAIRANNAFTGEIDRNALSQLLRFSYIPGPYSIFTNTYKLDPGSWISVRFGVQNHPEIVSKRQYWDPLAVVTNGISNRYSCDMEEQVEILEAALSEAVVARMVSDVPLGAFLSGGIDSSLVVALMQAASAKPVRTFSIGFAERGFDEAQFAKLVAKHIGTDHTELYVSPQDARDVIPVLPTLYDEPFADSSQIPTYLVSQLARDHVSVSLSGDGGDELFGGYHRYFLGRKIWEKTGWAPKALKAILAKGMRVPSPAAWQRILDLGKCLSLPAPPFTLTGERVHKLADVFAVASSDELYQRLISHWRNPTSIVVDSREPNTLLPNSRTHSELTDMTEYMMYFDLITYLPNDILVKVDRASMGVSLEARVPLLDHHVVECAWKIPLTLKVQQWQGKQILKNILSKYVPAALFERPKMGFGVPIDSWLRGPLRDWGEELLRPCRLRAEGFFDADLVHDKWQTHQSGKMNYQHHLWDLLMFQAWLEEDSKP